MDENQGLSKVESRESAVSSESSFYGNESVQATMENRPPSSDAILEALAGYKNLTKQAQKFDESPEGDLNNCFNPYEGVSSAWQYEERITDFIKRLPPSTSSDRDYGEWILVSSPQRIKSLEKHDIPAFIEGGLAILEEWKKEKAHWKSSKKSVQKVSPAPRTLKEATKRAEEQLLAYATEKGEIFGKWMLFPSVANVDQVWATVAKYTAEGELGIAAKVATAHAGEDRSRLICVYTKDFRDMADVKRVCSRLAALGLIHEKRSIYYKCDAYTYLGIDSRNEWGLKASIYSSAEVLGKD